MQPDDLPDLEIDPHGIHLDLRQHSHDTPARVVTLTPERAASLASQLALAAHLDLPEWTQRRRNGRHNAPDRVGRTCHECEAPRTFLYVRDRPVTATTGAWGKYVEPTFECRACGTEHSEGYTDWGPVAEADR